eukprot:scaffold51448_cov64-Phaeocystis_antarctica.AAC.5
MRRGGSPAAAVSCTRPMHAALAYSAAVRPYSRRQMRRGRPHARLSVPRKRHFCVSLRSLFAGPGLGAFLTHTCSQKAAEKNAIGEKENTTVRDLPATGCLPPQRPPGHCRAT